MTQNQGQNMVTRSVQQSKRSVGLTGESNQSGSRIGIGGDDGITIALPYEAGKLVAQAAMLWKLFS